MFRNAVTKVISLIKIKKLRINIIEFNTNLTPAEKERLLENCNKSLYKLDRIESSNSIKSHANFVLRAIKNNFQKKAEVVYINEEDKFKGTKYEMDFLKKLFLIMQRRNNGVYEGEKVDKQFFCFLTEKQESKTFKNLMQKFVFKKEDLMPKQEKFELTYQDLDFKLQNDVQFKLILKDIMKQYKHKKDKEERIKRQLFNNIEKCNHIRALSTNCCQYPLNRIKKNEFYLDDKYSDSIRTRSMFVNAATKELQGCLRQESQTSTKMVKNYKSPFQRVTEGNNFMILESQNLLSVE